MGLTRYLHPDFGSYAGYGIPVNVVSASRRAARWRSPGRPSRMPDRYPIPASPKIEGNGAAGDRHILMLDREGLPALGAVRGVEGLERLVGGIRRDLRPPLERPPPGRLDVRRRRRPPDLPGLARYDDVAAGVIAHALRFTVPETRKAHIYPARHHASSLTGAAIRRWACGCG